MEKSTQGNYSNDNLRFRKAYIRERLVALKEERDALVAERTLIDEKLGSPKVQKDEAGEGSSVSHLAEAQNKTVVSRLNGFGLGRKN